MTQSWYLTPQVTIMPTGLNGCPDLSGIEVSELDPMFAQVCMRCYATATPARFFVIPTVEQCVANWQTWTPTPTDFVSPTPGGTPFVTSTMPDRCLKTQTPTPTPTATPTGSPTPTPTATPAPVYYLEVVHSWIGLSFTTRNAALTHLSDYIVNPNNPDPVRGFIFATNRTGGGSGSFTFNMKRGAESGGGVGVVMNNTAGQYRCARNIALTASTCTTTNWSPWGLTATIVDAGTGPIFPQAGQRGFVDYSVTGLSESHPSHTFTLIYAAFVRFGNPSNLPTPTPTPTLDWGINTPAPNPLADCSQVRFRDDRPLFNVPDLVAPVGYNCYRIVPELVLEIPGRGQVGLDGVELCVTWVAFPSIVVFGITLSLDLLLVAVAAWFIRRLLGF